MEKIKRKQERMPGLASAATVLGLCILTLIGGILVFHMDTAVALLLATLIIVLYGIRNGIPYLELQEHMMHTLAGVVNVLVYITLIGALVGAFMSAGTIPYIICVGLKLISPGIFLPLTLIMCSIVSLCTGSGMSSTCTVGVAFVGIAEGMGVSLPLTAAAVACGAYLGDKQSPVSGFAAFTSGLCQVEIMKHCKSMLFTTAPAFVASLAAFSLLGIQYRDLSLDADKIDSLTGGLESAFRFSPVTILPLLLILVLIMMRIPSLPAIVLGTFAAVAVAIFYQGIGIQQALDTLMNGFHVDSELTFVQEIADRGGMMSMASTLLVIMMALCMGGAMDRTHIVEIVAGKLADSVKNKRQLIICTVFLTIFGHIATSHSLSSAVISKNALEKKYDELGVDRAVLSRSISDGAVVLSPIVPWCPDAMVCAQALGVATLTYAPCYFMIYFTILAAIVCAFTGIGTQFHKGRNQSVQYSR